MKNRSKLVKKYTLEFDKVFSLMIERNNCSGIDCNYCPFGVSNSVNGAYCEKKGNAKGCNFFIADTDKTEEMKELQKALREEHFKGELDVVYNTTKKMYKHEVHRMIIVLEAFYNSSEKFVFGKNFIKGIVTLYSMNTSVNDVLEIDNPEDMSKLAKIGMSELNNVIECLASDVNGELCRLEDCFNWRKLIYNSTLITELRKGSRIEFSDNDSEKVPF